MSKFDFSLWNRKSILSISLLVCVVIISSFRPTFAEITTISSTPSWRTGDGTTPTGIVWADIDGNGWLDIVTGNGCDYRHVTNRVYFNFDGYLDLAPGWYSDENQTTGNVAVGDLDNDGDMDVVATTLGFRDDGFPVEPQYIYYNNDGLESDGVEIYPSTNSFSCTLGDVDGDGDLDVGFAMGNYASSAPHRSKIYFNTVGILDTVNYWQTDSLYYAVDGSFIDIDNDDDLDLALTGRVMGICVFYNNDGVLETSPSWQSTHIPDMGRQIDFGDMNGDGYWDLAAAAMGNPGGYHVFMNNAGTLETEPSWSSFDSNEPATVSWSDADGDGDLDLAAGDWYGHLRIFENVDGTLQEPAAWSYNAGSIQQISWGDYDNEGVVEEATTFTCDGNTSLFRIEKKGLHSISSVSVNGTELSLEDYCYNLLNSWVSLATTPPDGAIVELAYSYSNDKDMVVSGSSIKIFSNSTVEPEPEIDILLIFDNSFGANYNFTTGDPNLNIRQIMESYGWNITTAGVVDHLDSCHVSGAYFNQPSIDVDTLISEIDDITRYDAISIMPGRGHDNLMNNLDLLNLVGAANSSGIVVSAWCRGGRVLARAGVLYGRRVVGKTDYLAEYEAAGAIFVSDDHPPIIDGNIVTGVRSRFYRTEMCEAIAEAIETYLVAPEKPKELPVKFNLEPNFPNPFNPSTNIKFSLLQGQTVNLTVYNEQGQIVKKLVDQQVMPVGEHEIPFDGSHLASGVYFCELKTEAYVKTIKMMLIK